MARHNEIGKLGEDIACSDLRKSGYSIVERNWRLGHLEVDIIAEDKETVVFVEVKTRTSTFGDIEPEQYVDQEKKRFLVVAANAYAKHKQLTKNIRFDIYGVLLEPENGSLIHLHHIEDAFHPQMRTISSGSYGTHTNRRFNKRK